MLRPEWPDEETADLRVFLEDTHYQGVGDLHILANFEDYHDRIYDTDWPAPKVKKQPPTPPVVPVIIDCKSSSKAAMLWSDDEEEEVEGEERRSDDDEEEKEVEMEG